MIKRVIKCKTCDEVLDSDDCAPWKTITCGCHNPSSISRGYDMGDTYVNTFGFYEVIG